MTLVHRIRRYLGTGTPDPQRVELCQVCVHNLSSCILVSDVYVYVFLCMNHQSLPVRQKKNENPTHTHRDTHTYTQYTGNYTDFSTAQQKRVM
jgi:hypothetical protein